ncbi:MAG TPA: hypothetical protein VL307_04725 [Chitinophagaceae bacterium]|nr:hypothetical protein [Chitinophagaceae bacterium]
MAGRDYPVPGFHPFSITVKIEGQQRRFTVLQTLKGIGEEHYKIIARNKTLLFSTNKPIVQRRGLENFPWTWTLIEGELRNQRALEAITAALEMKLRNSL